MEDVSDNTLRFINMNIIWTRVKLINRNLIYWILFSITLQLQVIYNG